MPSEATPSHQSQPRVSVRKVCLWQLWRVSWASQQGRRISCFVLRVHNHGDQPCRVVAAVHLLTLLMGVQTYLKSRKKGYTFAIAWQGEKNFRISLERTSFHELLQLIIRLICKMDTEILTENSHSIFSKSGRKTSQIWRLFVNNNDVTNTSKQR